MYHPKEMKADVSPVQWSKPYSILTPTQDSNPGGRIQNHKRWHYTTTAHKILDNSYMIICRIRDILPIIETLRMHDDKFLPTIGRTIILTKLWNPSDPASPSKIPPIPATRSPTICTKSARQDMSYMQIRLRDTINLRRQSADIVIEKMRASK